MPATQTAIEWCDSTWNPVHGCFAVSEGCANCYAWEYSNKMGHTPLDWVVGNADENVALQEHHLDFPRSLDEPRRIFVNSMSDLFLPEELLPDDYIHRVMDVVEDLPEHVFMVLTKHGTETGKHHGDVPRLRRWDEEYGRWPENLWMGVTVESRGRLYRLDELRRTDASTKWVSFEPLLEDVGQPNLREIDWAVVGGESHEDPEQRREMHHAWPRAIRRACRGHRTAFYFKQSSGAKQGHQPVLAEDGSCPKEAQWRGAGTSVHRELPELTDALREARPDLAAEERGRDE